MNVAECCRLSCSGAASRPNLSGLIKNHKSADKDADRQNVTQWKMLLSNSSIKEVIGC